MGKPMSKARLALQRHKAMLDATGSSGLASEKTLRSRGYDVDPQGGYTAPPQRSHPEQPKRRGKGSKTA
jgi:hypothetical protein